MMGIVEDQPQPTAPMRFPVAVVVAGVATFTVGLSPIGDAVRAVWDSLTLAIATWIGA
jgi:hypothetical protein